MDYRHGSVAHGSVASGGGYSPVSEGKKVKFMAADGYTKSFLKRNQNPQLGIGNSLTEDLARK